MQQENLPAQVQLDASEAAARIIALQSLNQTLAWLKKAVIGLNLCPFAKGPWQKQQIRFRVSAAVDAGSLLNDLRQELLLLAASPSSELETSLLIHPDVLQDFYDYNDFLSLADDLLVELELDGVLQIASFHPNYQFADSAPDDVENYTNRAPHPCLHLLKEESIDRAVDAFPEAAEIFEKNMQTMRNLGLAGWQALADWEKLS